jgi:NAD(P)-dependent dehydrogenase (short-subunit alcohol dehydrogenase family)
LTLLVYYQTFVFCKLLKKEGLEITNSAILRAKMPTGKQQLKTVLITGGGSGIGLATAQALLDTKLYRLVLLGRNRAKLEEATRTLGANPELVSISVCDLRNSSQIQKTMDKIVGTYKGIYGLINNAGIYPFGGVHTTTEESWDETMTVNLKAPLLLIQSAVAKMAKNTSGGRIVNVSSTAGLLPNHCALAYSVSKAALIHLTRTLAKELGKDSITVNCVCPGVVRTPLHEAYHQSESELEQFYAKRGSALPLARVGEPQDVSGAIKFFLSEEASWITGDILVADGGRLLV